MTTVEIDQLPNYLEANYLFGVEDGMLLAADSVKPKLPATLQTAVVVLVGVGLFTMWQSPLGKKVRNKVADTLRANES